MHYIIAAFLSMTKAKQNYFMKNKHILFALFIGLAACAVKKQVAEYQFPEEMIAPIKKQYAERCEKGQVLYTINCSRCHNVTEKRKEYIPDFNAEKLGGYVLSRTSVEHSAALPDTLITTEELGLIIDFLTYKKKIGIENKLVSTDEN